MQLGPPWDRVFRARTDEERAEAMRQTFAAAGALEGGLRECSKGKDFFGGDSVGYVDVVVGSLIPWAKATSVLAGAELVDAAKMPLLAAWMDRFGELDAAKAVMQDVDSLVEHGRMLMAKNAAPASNDAN
jgi:glutathione S-transferase